MTLYTYFSQSYPWTEVYIFNSVILYTCFTQSYPRGGFSKHKCLGKTSKPTDSESLMWRLEINIHKKFQRTFLHILFWELLIWNRSGSHSFGGNMIPSLFWKGTLVLSVLGASKAVTSTLATLDSSGKLLKTTIAGCTQIK